MPPVIETARLRLYAPRLEDLAARLAMERDPEVMRFIRPVSEDAVAHRTEIRGRILGPPPPRGAFWHVEALAAPGYIGWCGLFPLEDSGMIEVGYRYAPVLDNLVGEKHDSGGIEATIGLLWAW